MKIGPTPSNELPDQNQQFFRNSSQTIQLHSIRTYSGMCKLYAFIVPDTVIEIRGLGV